MKKFNFLSLLFAGFFVFFAFSMVKAQSEMPPNAQSKQADRESRPNLMAELGLTPDQRQQIRRVNAEKRPLARAAQERLRSANQNLDQAIYADNVNETEIQARLKDVQTAQIELIRIRFTNELAVRKILTAEQLAKFRDLREQFKRKLESNADQPQKNPLRNLKQGLKLRGRQLRQSN